MGLLLSTLMARGAPTTPGLTRPACRIVVSQPSLNVYSHDGQTDFPVPPRECNSCGTSDVDKFTLHEHVQTVMGGVCPGVSGQDNEGCLMDVS